MRLSDYSESITVASNYIQTVFGQFDANIKKIEKSFSVTMILRDDKLKVSGAEKGVREAVQVLAEMDALEIVENDAVLGAPVAILLVQGTAKLAAGANVQTVVQDAQLIVIKLVLKLVLVPASLVVVLAMNIVEVVFLSVQVNARGVIVVVVQLVPRVAEHNV